MYFEIPGGTYEEIIAVEGKDPEKVKCWIPPKPPDEQIANYGLPRSEQYWRRTPLPDWYSELREIEKKTQLSNSKYIHPKLQEFRNQEWTRRLEGYWFFNNGVATYLNGPCYYYVNWWRTDTPLNNGYVTYYDEIRKRYYFRQYCVEDPFCLGYLYISSRGTGKTSEEICAIVESLTRNPRKRKGVIQSKSEDDARDKVFREKVVPSYNDLPDFFKPISNHGTIPDKRLSFFRDLVRGKGAKDVTFGNEEELQNTLYYTSAKEKAISGGSYAEILNDEIGVTDPKKEADVYKRMQHNRFAVYRNNTKVGIIRATTTVEEMDKGGAECEKIWNESDQTKRTSNGYTLSGLYRYFLPDTRSATQFADKFGFIDEVKAKTYHDAERKARQYDGEALISYIRKNPRTIQEIFIKEANKCHFDAYLLRERILQIQAMDVMPYRCGNLEWKNNIRNTDIEWIPCTHPESEYKEDRETLTKYCPHCRWVVARLPNEKIANNVKKESAMGRWYYTPQNQMRFTAGCDPFQNSLLIDEGKGSKAGLYVKMKFDPTIDTDDKPLYEHYTNSPVVEYLCRPELYTFYEDVIKTLWFWGCELFPEIDKPGLKHWLRENGYAAFLINKPQGITKEHDPLKMDGGAASRPPTIMAYTDQIDYDIGRGRGRNIHKYCFPRLLYQLLTFDNSDTTKSDAAVSWGYTLLGCLKIVEPPKHDFTQQYVRTYGPNGQRIK